MDIILGLVQYFVDLGAAVMLPIVIFIVAICLGQSVGKAIKSGISIGRHQSFLSFCFCY